MGLNQIDFDWISMVRIKDFSCPDVDLDLMITCKYYKVIMHV
jgi:hypothetical protein